MSMSIGKRIRLNRLFSHPSGRLCSVAVDHFIGYGEGIPPGLAHIRQTLAAVVAGLPDAVTMHKGIAASAWAISDGANVFTINATGIGNISKTALSWFGCRLSSDFDNSAPTWSSNVASGVSANFADQTGTSIDPLLTVVHAAAAAANSGMFLVF